MIRVFSRYVSPKNVLLIASETLLIGLSLLSAVMLRFWKNPPEASFYLEAPEFVLQVCVFIFAMQMSFYYCDVYNPKVFRRPGEEWFCLWQALGFGSFLLGLIYFALPDLQVGRGVFFISVGMVPLFVVPNRLLVKTAWRAAAPRENLLIIGTRELAQSVARELAENDLNVQLAGFVAARNESGKDKVPADEIVGAIDRLEAIASERHISRIVVALEDRRGLLPLRDLVKLRVQGIPVEDAQSMLASLSGRVWLQTVQPSWFVFSDGFRRSRMTLIVKRLLDVVCAFGGLVASLPLMIPIAAAIRLETGGPVIYRQRRVGLKGRHFDVLKFRSMRVDAEQYGGAQWAQEDDPRVTRVGRCLRKYRLDELPQFLNVLRGEMSFVGPRPERPVFVEQLRGELAYYDERHSVRPGITGWAQVQYRYGASVEDAFRKLEYDLFYLKNMSVFFDCMIIFKTIRIVLGAHGGR